FSPAANCRYASAQRRGQRSSGVSKAAEPSQSWRARSRLSRMPSRRCSGESTRNSPPKLHHACPPRSCSPSRSSSSTRRPPSAISVAATRPARPAPTTITSASVAVPALMSVDLDAVHTLEVVGAVAPAHPTALLAVVLADLAVPGLEVAHLDLRLPLEVVALVGVAVVAVDAEVHPEEHGGPREERDGDAAGPGVGIGQQRHGRRIGGQLGEQREHGSSSEKELAEADDRADHRG